MSGVREERKGAAPIAEATAEPSGALTAEATAEPSGALTAEATAEPSDALTAEATAEPGTALTAKAAAALRGEPTAEAGAGLSGASTAEAATEPGIAPTAKAAAALGIAPSAEAATGLSGAPTAKAAAASGIALSAEAAAALRGEPTAEAGAGLSGASTAEAAAEPSGALTAEAATGLSGAPTAKAAAASGTAPSAKAAASGGRLISKTAAALSETPSAEVTAEPGAVPPAEPSSASSAASNPVSPDKSFLARPSDSSAPLRAAIFCFSDRGAALAERIAGLFPGARRIRPKGDLAARTAECFRECDALIFVGAAGIAVRAIAPHVAAKTADPAVIVADDCGRHVVSLLSGHIGGANRLTRQIAARIGAEPVVTTATDVNQRFSIDEWAARRGLSIESMDAAKRFSAEILRRDLPLTGDFPVDGPLPAGVFPGAEGDVGAAISCYRKHPFAVTALLSPRIVHLGIGCKRGAGAEAIAAAVDGLNLAPGAIVRAASIDVKAHEPGLLAFCRARGIEIRFYSAAELSAAEGEFTPSEFVKKTVGVDNVCERAAAVSAGPGAKIFIRKTRGDGVTVAAAMQDWRISFE